MYDFIAECLDPEKNNRKTARELLESLFITTLDDEKSKESVPLGPPIRRPGSAINKFVSNRKNHSIIPEEEEEASDHEDKKQAQQIIHDKSSDSARPKNPQDDPNATMQAGRISSVIKELQGEEKDGIISTNFLQV